MVGEDRVMMSGKELRRVHVIRQAMEKKLTQVEAGTLVGLTARQIRRLIQRVWQEGDRGLVHRGRGQPSKRRIGERGQAPELAMDSFGRYVKRYGIPLAVYADKHTTYQSPAQPTVEEQLAGGEPTSQFGRALGELGVELVPAHSPQAKGRVERLFKTFQDRLIK